MEMDDVKKKHKKFVEKTMKVYCDRTGTPFTRDMQRRINRKFKEVRREGGLAYAINHLSEINSPRCGGQQI